MKIKRIIAGMLAVVMCLSVTACGDKDNKEEKKTTTEATEKLPEDVKPPVKEVVETLGDFDLSDFVVESNVDPDFKVEIEGESGTYVGSTTTYNSKFLGEFSGDGFAAVSSAGASVEFEVEIADGGVYDLVFIAGGDASEKMGSVLIDGEKVTSLKINDSNNFAEYKLEKIELEEGTRKISVAYDNTGIYVDKFTVSAAAAVDPALFEVSKTLSNPNASDRTKRLYSFLVDVYGKYIISGNYAAEKNGIGGLESREFKELKRQFNEYPAIMGLDLIELSPSRASHGSVSNVVLHAMEWNAKGGIVTLAWHWNAPDGYLEVNGQPWWRGFYADSTNFNLGKALSGEDPEGYEKLLSDIDAIAEALKELEAMDIPILWRPLHEAGGDPKWNNPWFWWGTSGAGPYKELWILLYDRLTNYHKIDNLIWVWNAQNVDWYPGDEYVDMISYDIYADEHDTTTQKEIFDYIKGSTSTNKIIALSENGVIPDPDLCMTEGTRWSWFSVWSGEFTLKDAQLSDQYTPLETWQKVYSHDRVLTLSELPDLTCYPIDTEAYLAGK